MDDNTNNLPTVATPMIAAASRAVGRSERTSKRLTNGIVAGEFDMARLLKTMRHASGLSIRAVAERMGIEKTSLTQYFWAKRGNRGTSRLEWFLRYAEATGCTIWITFPSAEEQVRLQAAHPDKPRGNPNWVKRAKS